MNNNLKSIIVLILFAATFLSCKKDEDKTAQENLVGKWIIESSEILGLEVPGDGSYLRFNACAGSCTGIDYLASDSTSGTFSYVLSDDASTIMIVDTINNGGTYNGDWDVLELTESDLRIVTDSFLGSVKLEMGKQN